jgi:hypothetical protein
LKNAKIVSSRTEQSDEKDVKTVRYQLMNAFVVGQFAIPAATFINLDKAESEMSQWEQFAKGRTPPIDALSLDWDCSITMHESYPEFRHRLQRNLGPFHEEIFQRLVDGSLRLPRRGEVREWEKAAAMKASEAARHRELAARQTAWGHRVRQPEKGTDNA